MRLKFVLLALAALIATSFAGPAAADDRPAARPAPDWLRDGIVYEVFPRVFSPSGDFKGIVPQLDRLKSLGINVIWLMPIHPLGKLKAKGSLGSPYAVRDFDAINADYGSGADLKQLVAAAHKRDMKVFIDLVANHTAWDNVLISKHADWYTHDAGGRIVPPNPDWIDVADLDYSKQGLRDYMKDMMVRWLRDYQLDGFRADYAAGVPTDFWESVRPELDKARPGVVMLAEADEPAFLRKAFEIDYAWDFYHALNDALGGRAPASSVRETWERAEAKYPRGALRLRFSDNHDQLRATAQNGLPAALLASAIIYTLDGVPLLYNGMEIGDTTESAAPALFERTPIQWEMAERRPRVAPYYQALAAFRRAHPALTRGTVQWLRNGDEQRVLSYQRSGAGEALIIVANLSSRPYTGLVNVPAGTYQDVTPGLDSNARRAAAPPAVFLAPWEFRVFRRAIP